MSAPTPGTRPPLGRHPIDWISIASLILLTIVWGSSFALTTVALDAFSPAGILAGRLWLSTLVITGITLALGHRLPGDLTTWAWCAALGLLSSVIPFYLLAWGQQQVPSSVAAVLLSGGPLFTLALSRILLDETVSLRRWLGFVVGLAGLIWLIGPSALRNLGLASDLAGQLACLGASLSYATGSILIRLMPKLPPLKATMSAQLAATVISLPLLWNALPGSLPAATPLLALITLGLVQTAGAQLLRFFIVRRAGPVFMSMVGYLIPIWAGVLGVALLGEALTWQMVLGFGIIVAGLILTRQTHRN